MITRKILVEKLQDYLYHKITLDELVDWAENALMEEEFDPTDFELLRDIISRLGLTDVREFGLMWEDFEDIFSKLGYRVYIKMKEMN
ncbi:MAG: hypothetical protein D6732_05760 [Methanobacteriota archaeon]|nr:MAG: hypothetical protein D6732_05760 [Euryarchaeota archaeon]